MPFSSLNDPAELARARAALEAAWNEIKAGLVEAVHDRERTRLAYIVASLAKSTKSQEDLTRGAIERYRNLRHS